MKFNIRTQRHYEWGQMWIRISINRDHGPYMGPRSISIPCKYLIDLLDKVNEDDLIKPYMKLKFEKELIDIMISAMNNGEEHVLINDDIMYRVI